MTLKSLPFLLFLKILCVFAQFNWENDENCGIDSKDILSGPGLTSSLHGSEVEVPWAALINFRSELLTDYSGAAVIISPYLILAVANTNFIEKDTTKFHFQNVTQYFVTVGTTKFGDPVHNFDPNAQTVDITHISIHPRFKAGYWSQRKSDLALIHLKTPLKFSERVRPICLPNTKELSGRIEEPGEDNFILSGWNRAIAENMFLRMSTQPQQKCRMLWKDNNETLDGFYENRFCALAGKENDHTTCIHKDVAGAKMMQGRYYLAGIVNNFFSLNQSRICYPDSEFYFTSYLNDGTYQWISNSARCGPNNFTCHNGQCVGLSSVCDKVKQCYDGSDENGDFCRGQNFCRDDQFPCGDYGECIPKYKVNDGVLDCEGGEDEDEDEDGNNGVLIWASCSGAVITIAVLGLFGYIYYLHAQIRDLTKEEVEEFFQGTSLSQIMVSDCFDAELALFDAIYVNDPVQNMPWKKEYEIPRKRLEIEKEINSGNFGIVYKAQLVNSVKEHYANYRVEVAAKTHKKSVGVQEFKALLCEVKIAAFVGRHANVVSFIGACTENIKKRSVFLVVEYCPLGDLRNYLISNETSFVDLLNSSTVICPELWSHTQSKINSKDLLKWCAQIAKGMDWLASKNVVHGDLAARNVFLGPTGDAKIGDFGLSRQLGGSGVYVKTSQDPIPWKWLPLESLRDKSFTSSSDSWSYGVTIWEIFSLGKMPYQGKMWDRVFESELEDGQRLPQPQFATTEIYEIMLSCWDLKPENRPVFSILGEIFDGMLDRLVTSQQNNFIYQ